MPQEPDSRAAERARDETDRSRGEQNRASGEEVRTEGEENRTEYEGLRDIQEQGREVAEQSREYDEILRKAAEETRAAASDARESLGERDRQPDQLTPSPPASGSAAPMSLLVVRQRQLAPDAVAAATDARHLDCRAVLTSRREFAHLLPSFTGA